MNTRKVYLFLALTVIWSWTFWLIGLNQISDGLNQESFEKFLKYFFIGVYGPTASALIVTFLFDGFSGLIRLVAKIFIWKTSFKNYLYIIILPILFVVIGIGFYQCFFGAVGSFDTMAVMAIPATLWAGLYAGPLGEELGWRGFLLPELTKKFSNLKSAVIIGMIWFCWHIPLFWAPFGTLVSGAPITFLPVVTYWLIITCLSIIITWLSIRSKGSVLMAILFHLSINAGIALLFFPELALEIKKVHLLSVVGMIGFVGYLIKCKQLNVDYKSESQVL